jgi:hypothetical protein
MISISHHYKHFLRGSLRAPSPLLATVEDRQDFHAITSQAVRHHERRVGDDELTRAGHSTGPAELQPLREALNRIQDGVGGEV